MTDTSDRSRRDGSGGVRPSTRPSARRRGQRLFGWSVVLVSAAVVVLFVVRSLGAVAA